MIKKLLKTHLALPLKIAPSKNALQNCYKLRIGNKSQNPVSLKTQDM